MGEINIHGLGTFSNGVHEISDEQELNFRVLNTTEDTDVDTDPESPTYGSHIVKHELGPSLAEAVSRMHGVTVSGSTKSGTPVGSGSGRAPGDNDTPPREGDDL